MVEAKNTLSAFENVDQTKKVDKKKKVIGKRKITTNNLPKKINIIQVLEPDPSSEFGKYLYWTANYCIVNRGFVFTDEYIFSTPSKMLRCAICGKEFKNNRLIRNHLNSHSNWIKVSDDGYSIIASFND